MSLCPGRYWSFEPKTLSFFFNNSFHFSKQRRMLWIPRANIGFLGTQECSTELKTERANIKETLYPIVFHVLPIKNIWSHNILPDRYGVTQMSVFAGRKLVLCLLLQVMTHISLLRAFDMLKLLKLHKSIDCRTVLRVSKSAGANTSWPNPLRPRKMS